MMRMKVMRRCGFHDPIEEDQGNTDSWPSPGDDDDCGDDGDVLYG